MLSELKLVYELRTPYKWFPLIVWFHVELGRAWKHQQSFVVTRVASPPPPPPARTPGN